MSTAYNGGITLAIQYIYNGETVTVSIPTVTSYQPQWETAVPYKLMTASRAHMLMLNCEGLARKRRKRCGAFAPCVFAFDL